MMDQTTSTSTVEAVRILLQGTASVTGEQFFRALVQHFAQALQVKYTFVAEITDDRKSARTLAMWADGRFEENFEYELAGTACEPILEARTVYYPHGLQRHFPKDEQVRTLGVESYIGVPLIGPTGLVLGHVVAMHDEPMADSARDFSSLEVFAARASAELERHRTQKALEHRLAIEGLVSSISTSFINLPPEDIEGSIDDAIARIGQFGKVDRVWMIRLSKDQKTYTYTHEWCADGVPSAMEIGYVMDRSCCPLFPEDADTKSVLHIPRVRDLPESSHRLREALEKDDVKSVLVVPMLLGGEAIGAVAFDSVKTEKQWSDEDIRLLQLVAEVFSQALERQHSDAELKRAQATLVQSEKMAALGQLTAGIAHEINTPAAVIKSGADVTSRAVQHLRRNLSNGQVADAALKRELLASLDLLEESSEVHASASTRIAEIVESLRRFTHIDEAAFQEADLHEGIESVLTLLSGHLKPGVRIHRNFSVIPKVQSYPSELNQVFMTLLKNANEAIDGEGTVAVSTETDNHNVYIRVADTGKGIPPAEVASLFDVGFSANGSRVRMRTGLSSALSIVKKHGGDLDVTSEPGKGTEFTIRLPIKSGHIASLPKS